MKRFLILVIVFVSLFAFASCGSKKKEKPRFEEEITKEIKAEEGGTIESSDGKTSIEVSAGALDSDTVITMRIYNSSEYSFGEGEQVVTKVVEFQPSGLIFKKPLIITMPVENAFHKRILTAAVLKESENRWSYNEHGVYAVLAGREAGGDPIMLSAGGDPIMLNAGGDPIMMDAGGDPIMLAAAGDPIMLKAGGDPIMISSLGDPIMSAAMGDPIMMTTGHFTAFTFIALESAEYEPGDSDSEPARPDGNEPVDDSDTDTTEPDGDGPLDDTDIAEPDGDTDEPEDTDSDEPDSDIVIPEPGTAFSKVPCTGLRTCINDHVAGKAGLSTQDSPYIGAFECPGEGDSLYGQDTNYIIRKSCVPQSFEELPKAEGDETPYIQTKDNVTGLTWLFFTNESGSFEEMSELCGGLDYAGKTWRLPTPKEFLSIVDGDRIYSEIAFRPLYFPYIASADEENGIFEDFPSFWTSSGSFYLNGDGSLMRSDSSSERNVMCVSGDEYGKVDAGNYAFVSKNVDTMVFDATTNLFWQKDPVVKNTWKEALSYCENLEYAGYSDWRLPSKNDLVTIVDYSKADENVVSSFPGMTEEVLVSSTPRILINDERVSFDPWVVSMYKGTVLLLDEASGQLLSYSVRCVRSDLTEAPADGIPECDEKTGYTPCRHEGILWSPRMVVPPSWGDSYLREMIMEACRDMTLGGKRQWRGPTIDELRTLMKDEMTKTGGTCRVSSECNECYTESECHSDESYESKLGDYEILISGDYGERSDWPPVWAIYPLEGDILDFREDNPSKIAARCVFDETLPDYEFPYTRETGEYLTWSSLTWSYMARDEAVEYCETLDEGGINDWRLPSREELIDLFIDEGPYHDEKQNSYGKNSFFGDVTTLWTSYIGTHNSYSVIDFLEGSGWSVDENSRARVRCVYKEPCVPNFCAGLQHSDGTCSVDDDMNAVCGCDENYTWNGVDGVCAANTKSEECTGDLPEHAEWWSESITQTWSGNAWLPEITGEAIFSESEVENECRFKCIDGYFWSGSSCLVVTPYTDPETLLTWSAEAENAMDWDTAVAYCEDLDEGGFSDWRLPTIDELRTVIQNCEKTQPGGICALSDPDHLLYEEDYVSEDCSCGYVENNNGGYYSKLGYSDELGNIWSSSVEPDDPSEILGLLFYDGSAGYYLRSDVIYARCVRKDSPVLPSN